MRRAASIYLVNKKVLDTEKDAVGCLVLSFPKTFLLTPKVRRI